MDNLKESPTLEELEEELGREEYKFRFKKVLRNTVYSLITVAAVAVLMATLLFPVLQIYGTSMTPTLSEGQIVLTLKKGTLSDYQQGDIVAFYYNNKVLVKRVIATGGDYVYISDSGVVSVNGQVLDEPYVDALSLGECDMTFPYQVPEGKYFLMGDHRSVSIDSRTSAIGAVSEEDIVSKIFLRVWPLTDISLIE